jgi:hypothetical protein
LIEWGGKCSVLSVEIGMAESCRGDAYLLDKWRGDLIQSCVSQAALNGCAGARGKRGDFLSK